MYILDYLRDPVFVYHKSDNLHVIVYYTDFCTHPLQQHIYPARKFKTVNHDLFTDSICMLQKNATLRIVNDTLIEAARF